MTDEFTATGVEFDAFDGEYEVTFRPYENREGWIVDTSTELLEKIQEHDGATITSGEVVSDE